jgi:anti-sigma-K factor RskA
MTALPDDILDLLAAYALGALEPDEIARVSALLAEHPELRATLAELRATADRLPYGLPEALPAPELRQRVLDYATGRASAPPSAAAPTIGRTRAWIWSFTGVAIAALLLAAIGWAQLLGARNDLAQTQAQVATMQGELSQLQKQVAVAQKVIASLQGQSGSAAIVQTRAGGTLLVAQLPPLAQGRVYQVWRIPGSGNPLSTGLFKVDQQGYGQIALPPDQQPQAGETIAVTDEPDGGSAGPTTQPLIAGTSR